MKAEALARAGRYGRWRTESGSGRAVPRSHGDAERTKAEGHELMEAVVERGNLWLAYQRVVENKGAPGVDGITVAEFKD